MSDQKTILVVDDNEPTRTLLRGILEAEGYAVIEASDGEVAIAMAKEQKPDAALIDQYMEPYNGYKTAEIMGFDGIKMPMIMITAHDATDLLSQAQRHGFSNVMKKPIDPKKLLWLLARELR
ncbi:MAG: response regulator [Pseudomonadota bacterium]